MSLGDTLRLLRAKRGGVTPLAIDAATGLSARVYRQMEQRYRPAGDEDAVRVLAEYYDVPVAELHWRLEWSRKDLSRALARATADARPLTLELWNGQTVAGMVRWWDLGAIGLATADEELLVVQRHAVQRWQPRAEE